MLSAHDLLKLENEGLSCAQIAAKNGLVYRNVWARLKRAKEGHKISSGRFKAKYAPIEIGEKFGSWTVLEKGSFKHNQQRWVTACDCGSRGEVAQQHLRGKKSTCCVKCQGKKKVLRTIAKGKYCSNRRNEGHRAQVEQLYRKQSGLCLLCEKPFGSVGDAAWDHDHETGLGRGLLHKGCNVFLGFIERHPGIAERALSYLAEHKDAQV